MSHSLTLSHYHLPRMQEMGRLYWCHTIGALGIFIAAIFVPVYLLKLGYSIREVFIFLICQQAFSALTQYPTSRLFQYISPHYLIGVGRLSFVVFFWLMMTLPVAGWPLALIALFWAINRSAYWSALHYAFGLSRAHEHSGRQVAKINALAILATTLAPAFGGIIATAFGINYTYIVAMLLIGISVLPLVYAPDYLPRAKLKITRKLLTQTKRDAFANGFNGMVLAAEQSIWPIFVSLIVISYAGIGILSSVIAIASAAVMVYVGRREEVKGERHYIKEGLFTYSITSLGRTAVQTSTQIFGLNMLAGIARALYITPFMNRYYANSDGSKRLGYITIMETSFSIGSSLYLLTLLCLLVFFSAETVLAIGLGAMAFLVIGVKLLR